MRYLNVSDRRDLNTSLYNHVYFIPSLFAVWCKIPEPNAMCCQMSPDRSDFENFASNMHLQNLPRVHDTLILTKVEHLKLNMHFSSSSSRGFIDNQESF